MSERVMPGPVSDTNGIREAVCIHTKKIYDSCRDRDCIEDLRFYPTQSCQHVIERAMSIRSGKAELLNVHIDVESTGFNKGFYSVDIRYFYKITAEAYIGAARPIEVTGLAIFDKRVILFGGEGTAKTFSSELTCCDDIDDLSTKGTSDPTAFVEAVDPIVLNMKLVEPSNDCCMPCPPPCCPPPPCGPMGPGGPGGPGGPDFPVPGPAPLAGPGPMPGHGGDCDCFDVPPGVSSCFGSDLSFGNDRKRVYVTLGQFSIIRLERDSQLLIPVYDYCLPNKECTGISSDEDPCELFRQVQFPVDDFFPPSAATDIGQDTGNGCCRYC